MREIQQHENGIFTVEDGSIFCKMTNTIIENPAIMIDMETGGVLKNGDVSIVAPYFHTFCERHKKMGMEEELKWFKVITFEKYGAFSADELCTLMNYMRNSIGPEKMAALLNMDEKDLKEKLQKLSEIGW